MVKEMHTPNFKPATKELFFVLLPFLCLFAVDFFQGELISFLMRRDGPLFLMILCGIILVKAAQVPHSTRNKAVFHLVQLSTAGILLLQALLYLIEWDEVYLLPPMLVVELVVCFVVGSFLFIPISTVMGDLIHWKTKGDPG